MKNLRNILVIVLLCVIGSTKSRYSSKTPYTFEERTKYSHEGFELVRVWGLIRHGTRFPSAKQILKYNALNQMKEIMLENSISLRTSQWEAFASWSPLEIPLENEKLLHAEGEKELIGIGSRLRKRFPSLFKHSPDRFIFKHTPTQRTEVSALKFIEGLFPDELSSETFNVVETPRDDKVLRPYKGCTHWRKNVKKNKPVSLIEKKKFIDTGNVTKLVEDMRVKSQISDLSTTDMMSIYILCGYETAWMYKPFEGRSVWCSLFDDDQLKIMEYMRDLEYFWVDGPGFEITRSIACKTVGDMIENLKPDNEQAQHSFYFTHSGTVVKLLAYLGLYYEYDLTAETFNDDRMWKTSHIDMFASNIFAVLFKSDKTNDYYIQILHQENVVKIPKCQSTNEHGMCKFDEFVKLFTRPCDLDELCKIRKKNKDEL